MKHKKLLISLTTVAAVVIFLFVFLMVWFFGDRYGDFNGFRQEFSIPGLDDGAVPQGMGNCSATYETENDGETTTATQQYYFISAYMVDGSPSRIYVTGADTGYVGYVTMLNTDGTDYKGHCGGIAANGVCLWVTGENTVYVAKVSSSSYTNIAQEIIAKAAQGGQSVKFTASFNANCEASFCYYYDDPSTTSVTNDRLYVGEFYRKGNYDTSLKHRVTTPNGYANTAFVYEYNVSSSSVYGLANISSTYSDAVDEKNDVPEIKKIISIPEKIQGFARANNMLVLSQSYGLSNSHLLCYDWSTLTGTDNREKYSTLAEENFVYEGITRKSGAPFTVSSLYVYFADNNNGELFLNDYSIPCMSEGLCTSGSRVYVLFESAGKKYRAFVRERVKYVYSMIPHKG